MAKYSFEFKLRVVNDYLSGVGGYQFLRDKYGLPNLEMVQKWVNAYKQLGVSGLQRKRKNAVFDSNFKLNAVNLYLTSELSYREVANQLGLNNRVLITRWVKEYRQNGEFAFALKIRGRPRKRAMSQSKSKKSKEKLSKIEQELAEAKRECLLAFTERKTRSELID
ncbi:MAG TPA: transposase [Lactovum miscens]|uniref:transposase n=1 Tax=Lactovum miscens TaxID=190387 RepID=UPI002EDB106A